MSHILITGQSASGKSTVVNDTVIPAYTSTHDIVRVPTGSTATGLRKAARQVSPDRPTLVVIDEVRRPSIIKATELLLDTADPSKVKVVVIMGTGTIEIPANAHHLHLTREYFLVNYVTQVAA